MLKASANVRRAGGSGEGVLEGERVVPLDAVVVPVLVDEAVVVAVAVGREEPVGAPVGEGAALCVALRVPSGEALCPEEDGDADADTSVEAEALPLTCADAVEEWESEGLPVGTLMVRDTRGDAVLASNDALVQPLLEGGAAVALAVVLPQLLAESHWVYVRVPVGADVAVRAGVTVRVPLPPASDAVAHAVAVGGRTVGDTRGDRDAEIAAEGEALVEVEPQGDAEAVGLPLALWERLAGGLTVGDRECKKSAPSSNETFPAELTLQKLGAAWGQYASTKPAQSAREKSVAS